MKKISWQAELIAPPPVFKYCKKCGEKTPFHSSGLFRVNAQSIDPALLERFHRNDSETARRYASDISFLRRNGGEPGQPEYRVNGEAFPLEEETELEIQSAFDLPVKISTLVRHILPLSHSTYAALVQQGKRSCPDGRDPVKGRVKTGVVLRFL